MILVSMKCKCYRHMFIFTHTQNCLRTAQMIQIICQVASAIVTLLWIINGCGHVIYLASLYNPDTSGKAPCTVWDYICCLLAGDWSAVSTTGGRHVSGTPQDPCIRYGYACTVRGTCTTTQMGPGKGHSDSLMAQCRGFIPFWFVLLKV